MRQFHQKTSFRGRAFTASLLFLCLTVILLQRGNINVVVPQIVTIKKEESSTKILWKSIERSVVLMAFYIGFCTTQIVGGITAEKYGSKNLLAICVAISSICTLLSPLALEHSTIALIMVRIIIGCAQGVYLPSVVVMIANWFQPSYQSIATGIILPGTQLGTILAMVITSAIAVNQSWWRLSFYIFGGMGLLWIVVWFIFVTDNPQTNKWITNDEKELLSKKITRNTKSNLKEFPLRQALTSPPLLSVMVAHFAASWNFAIILTIIPILLQDLFYIEIKDQTYLSFMAPLFTWIGGTTSGIVADVLIKKKILPKLTIRKILNFMCSLPSALFFLLVTLFSRDKYQYGIVLLLLATYMGGIQFTAIMPNVTNIAPQFCGVVMGISNTFASLAAVASILLTSEIVTDQHKASDWQIAFGIMTAIQFIGFVCFTIFAQEEVQSWAKIETQPTEEIETP